MGDSPQPRDLQLNPAAMENRGDYHHLERTTQYMWWAVYPLAVCDCGTEFYGDLCENSDVCDDPNMCLNGGTCINLGGHTSPFGTYLSGTYACDCPWEYVGAPEIIMSTNNQSIYYHNGVQGNCHISSPCDGYNCK